MSTLTWTESHPAWTPAPVFEAEIGNATEQRNYLQISQLSRHIRVDPNDPSKGIKKVAHADRFAVSRIAEPGGELAIDTPNGRHIFGTLAEAKAAAQVYFDHVWTPLIIKKHANEAMIARQYADYQARQGQVSA